MSLAAIKTMERRSIGVTLAGNAPTQTIEIALTFPSAYECLEPAEARRLGRILVKLADVVDEARAGEGEAERR